MIELCKTPDDTCCDKFLVWIEYIFINIFSPIFAYGTKLSFFFRYFMNLCLPEELTNYFKNDDSWLCCFIKFIFIPFSLIPFIIITIIATFLGLIAMVFVLPVFWY